MERFVIVVSDEVPGVSSGAIAGAREQGQEATILDGPMDHTLLLTDGVILIGQGISLSMMAVIKAAKIREKPLIVVQFEDTPVVPAVVQIVRQTLIQDKVLVVWVVGSTEAEATGAETAARSLISALLQPDTEAIS